MAAVSVLALAACGQSAANGPDDSSGARNPGTLVFAAVPAEESTGLEDAYQPVMDMLKRETGKQIRFQKATDYAAIIEGQRNGKVDIAAYGPFSYVLARTSGVKATPVGAEIDEKGGKPGYRSYGITKSGSKIRGLADFKAKKICFVDPNSTSGYLYPKAGLIKAGVDPENDVNPVMAGGHDASALAVANGQCQAGFAFDSMVDKQLIAKGQLKKGQLDTVWKSELIAGSPLAISDDHDPKLKNTIAKSVQDKANVDYLMANGFCAKGCAVGFEKSWGYAKVDDSSYNGVRKVCQITKDKQCTEG
ncbi:MAG: phosphate/phosphite/phosphonate ABC transporter substrate-binding protein [Pseudonocardiaceae bacterium]|nr:phosphate/phosphite/phosphonate ABC transporter substrate-binding protein [Pseudonocardiaceae bacterium]